MLVAMDPIKVRRQINEMVAANEDLNAADDDGDTLFHKAVWNDQVDNVRLLLKYGADPLKRNKWGDTAFHYAASRGDLAIANLLLETGFDVDEKNEWGETALHMAATHGRQVYVEFLLDHHADVSTKTDKGNTPLLLAALFGYQSIIELLLAKRSDVESQNNQGDTALHLAVPHGRHLVRRLLNASNNVHHFVNIKNDAGETALFRAIRRASYGVVNLLLKNGAAVNVQNRLRHNTPLHEACSCGQADVVTSLVKHRAQLDARNVDGLTPNDVAKLSSRHACMTALKGVASAPD